MTKRIFKLFITALFAFAVLPLSGSDAEAEAKYNSGRELYLKNEYRDAAKNFADSYILASSPAIRANSLLAQIGAYRMCGLYYEEFKAIELVLDKYAGYGNYQELVNRQFEIGEAFHQGRREPAFWALRWVPWLTGPDHTAEIFNKALKRSPYAAKAPRAMLLLAHWYEMEGKTGESLDMLRKLLQDHPNAPESRYAMLALGNGLLEIARNGGDGDGMLISESVKLFTAFSAGNEKAPELDFAKRKIAEAKDIQAEHLQQMADYYRGQGRSEVAARYLAKLVQRFPDSPPAAKAEKELAEIDRTYLPGDFAPLPEPRLMQINAYKIPAEAEKELISPLTTDSHYLQPLPDLQIGNSKTVGK